MSEGAAVRAAAPDLLYVVGPGTSGHEELRYSLRSVTENLRHRKVWISGSIPDWVTSVETIDLDPLPAKYDNIRQSLTCAIERTQLSDEFILMNDDHFVIEHIEGELPAFHLGPTADHLKWLRSVGKRGEWLEACEATHDWLDTRNFYENHTPLLFSKTALSAVLRAYPAHRPVAPGLLYEAARAGKEGVLGPDAKVTNGSLERANGIPFISTVDWSFQTREVGHFIRSLFPRKCRYEL